MAKYSDGLKRQIWSEGFLHIFEGSSVLEIFDGPIPADANRAIFRPPLLRMMLPNNPFKLLNEQIVDVNPSWQSLYGDVLNTGVPTWARIRKVADLNHLDITAEWPRLDVTVGDLPPAELVLDVAYIGSDTIIKINNFTLVVDVVLTLPVITLQPFNLNLHVGAPATFTIAAEGLLPLGYQWQRDSGSGWNNIGTDSPTYSIASVSSGYNLNRFRVLVTNESGSILSDIATILVA